MGNTLALWQFNQLAKAYPRYIVLVILVFLLSFASYDALMVQKEFHNDFNPPSAELMIDNGWTYQPNCALYPSPFYQNSSYVQCNGQWIPPTEERRNEIHNGINLPVGMIIINEDDDFYLWENKNGE